MPISAVDSISLAFQHTRQQLFQPFRAGQWIRLAVVGALAGEVGSTGGCNFNIPRQPGASRHFLDSGFAGADPVLLAGAIAVLVFAGLVIGILLMYASSVMRFVLFDSVIAKECRIGEGWSHRQSPGLKYFVWKLIYLATTIAGLVVLIGIPAGFAFAMGWLQQPKEHVIPLVLGGIMLFFALLFFVFSLAFVFVLTKDFVVPQMALEGIGAFEGWRRLWPMMKAAKADYAAYIGMKIVMAIAAGILVGIVTLIVGLIIAIPTVGLAIIAVVTGKTAGLTWNVYSITLAVVVGAILFAIVTFIVALVSVPVVVFFPAYSIYFFAGRYPALSAIVFPPAASAPAIVSTSFGPPDETPPLPRAPSPVG